MIINTKRHITLIRQIIEHKLLINRLFNFISSAWLNYICISSISNNIVFNCLFICLLSLFFCVLIRLHFSYVSGHFLLVFFYF